MEEFWKPVISYEGLYEVSNLGRVRTVERTLTRKNGALFTVRARVLKTWSMSNGNHQFVGLYTSSPGGRSQTTAVHRIVLEAFVGPCPEGMECCHNDGNPRNNNVTNLRWDTRSANQMDSVRHGTKPQGTAHYRAKLKPEDIPDIRKRIASGESLSSIGRLYKVATIAISCIRDGITWKHVT
jgi:hypothetical protein